MTRNAVTLTARGWALLLAAAGMAVAAILFGIQELYPLGAAALVLVAAARVWVGTRSWDVRVQRQMRPGRVPAGADARVDLVARNHSSRRSPVIAVRDPFDRGRRWASFGLAPLSPGEGREASYRVPTSRRGVFAVGPLEIELRDPFGLARTRRFGSAPSTLTVHPRVDLVGTGPLPADNRRDIRVPLPLLGPAGDEFYGLREYRDGDDLRRVHWSSTARVDELMIRQPENLWKGRVTVIADVRPAVHDDDSFEEVLRIAASIAASALRAGVHVRLTSTSGVDSGFGSTPAHRATILDALAAIESFDPGSGADRSTVAPVRVGGPVVIITTDRASDADVGALGGGRINASTVVIVERRPADRGAQASRGALEGTGPGSTPSAKLVRVPYGTAFREVWERVG